MNDPVGASRNLSSKGHIASIDAFRGFTVLAMIFVNFVAGYSDLPLTMSWFGSPPVTTFHHAASAAGNTTGVGLTFTDLVAPFFVFIVGLVIPLSRKRRGAEWWKHVGSRTAMLIFLGVIYLSLIFGLSWWWGILQAIGIAYLMGCVLYMLPPLWRWISVFAIGAFHQIMSLTFPWWLNLGNPQASYWTIANLSGDMLRPLTAHCTPWASISYGVITIVGTLLGESLSTGDRRVIIRQGILIGTVFCLVGYGLHRYDWPVFGMSKETVSTSYALFSSGVSAFVFLIFYLVIDVAHIQKWAWVFIVFGSNALLGYFLQPIVRIALYSSGFKPYLTGYSGWTGMIVGLGWTALLWLTLLWCNKKNLYWRI